MLIDGTLERRELADELTVLVDDASICKGFGKIQPLMRKRK